ncbi:MULTISPECIES: hypothetical protein [unclassified Mesorhizobium]|nr:MULTISPECIES: hypothetical protein [unclassified Mesorhizobium]
MCDLFFSVAAWKWRRRDFLAKYVEPSLWLYRLEALDEEYGGRVKACC